MIASASAYRRWAISPSAHWAVCDASPEALRAGSPALEWFAVGGPAEDGGVLGERTWGGRQVGALGWLDDDQLVADGELIVRSRRRREGRLHTAP